MLDNYTLRGCVALTSAEQIRELLSQVYDPELGINIVDLGLVYDILIKQAGVGEDQIFIKMTLTTPGCPMHDTIVGGVRRVLRDHDIDQVKVDLVWEPRWSPEMISAQAKEILGMF